MRWGTDATMSVGAAQLRVRRGSPRPALVPFPDPHAPPPWGRSPAGACAPGGPREQMGIPRSFGRPVVRGQCPRLRTALCLGTRSAGIDPPPPAPSVFVRTQSWPPSVLGCATGRAHCPRWSVTCGGHCQPKGQHRPGPARERGGAPGVFFDPCPTGDLLGGARSAVCAQCNCLDVQPS